MPRIGGNNNSEATKAAKAQQSALELAAKRTTFHDKLIDQAVALIEMEFELINKAGEVFNEVEWQQKVDNPNDYAPDDPRRTAAQIAMANKLKAVAARIASGASTTPDSSDLVAMEKKIIAADDKYWQHFDLAKTVDPHWHQSATTYLATMKCMAALSVKNPANAQAVLVKLGKEYEAKATVPFATDKQDYLAQSVPPSMAEAFARLLEAHQEDSEKNPDASAGKPLLTMDATAIRDLGNTWKKLNLTAEKDAAEMKASTIKQYEKLQDQLHKMLAAIEAVPPPPAKAAPAAAPKAVQAAE